MQILMIVISYRTVSYLYLLASPPPNDVHNLINTFRLYKIQVMPSTNKTLAIA